MVPPYNQFTEDGYDMQFGTNVLGTLNVSCPRQALTIRDVQDIIS